MVLTIQAYLETIFKHSPYFETEIRLVRIIITQRESTSAPMANYKALYRALVKRVKKKTIINDTVAARVARCAASHLFTRTLAD